MWKRKEKPSGNKVAQRPLADKKIEINGTRRPTKTNKKIKINLNLKVKLFFLKP
jgi:uncharacterized OsmC-like protein